MTSRFIASRRRTLQQLGLALGSAAMSAAARAVPIRGWSAADAELAAAAERLIAHRRSAAVIGVHYLAQCENENSAELLARAIREGMPAEGIHVDERSLIARIRSDFEHGEVVNLQGWVLSRTEARLCALFAV